MNKKDEQAALRRLHAKGLNYSEIGKEMQDAFPRWARLKHPDRSAKKAIESMEDLVESLEEKTLDEMTRKERYEYIKNKLESTPRFVLAFSQFSESDKRVFIDEYLNVVKSIDSLTEAEEQSLFSAITSFVLAYKALNRKEREEKLYEETLQGLHAQGDPEYRSTLSQCQDYAREHEKQMSIYQKSIDQLKMSREQRLKEIRSEKKTLVDLAEEMSHKNIQAEVAVEIERLSKLRDEELKRMIESGYLFGSFEE